MKLPALISALILVAVGAVYFAPEPEPDVELPLVMNMHKPHFMKPDMPVVCVGPQSEQRCVGRI